MDRKNDELLGVVLHKLNAINKIFAECLGGEEYWSLDRVIEYAEHFLGQINERGIIVTKEMFDACINLIVLQSAGEIIEKQWKDIHASTEGNRSFYETFNDVFENAITKYETYFIHKMNSSDILCRMVKEKECDTERFIPIPGKSINRWNPPDKVFLYLSYAKDNEPFRIGLKKSEYICLLECRTEHGKDCCFCYFKPEKEGRVLDLSYNDVELSHYSKILSEYTDSKIKKIMSDLYQKYNDNSESVSLEVIQKGLNKNPISEEFISIVLAKMILQLICRSIYKKVDENQEEKYKSFHLLANYLIDKGITGIIYPCTRDEIIKGKNIVLFDINDATPIDGTIKQYHFE